MKITPSFHSLVYMFILVIILIINQYLSKLAVIALSLIVLYSYYPKKKTSEMSTIEVTPFQDVTVPNTAIVEQAVQKAVVRFNQFAKLEIDDVVLKKCIEVILKEEKIFRELTRKSVYGSDKIADYCLEIVSYIETLLEDGVEGAEFLEALLSNTNKCKSEIDFLAEGYTKFITK